MASPQLTGRTRMMPVAACAALLIAGLVAIQGFDDLGARADRFIPLYLALFLVYLAAIALVAGNRPAPDACGRRQPMALPFILGAGLIMRLVLLPGDPTLSDDIYRYIHDGHVQTQGINPFHLPPSEIPGSDPRINHPEIRTIYPPGMQILFAITAWVSPGVTAMKVLAMVFDLGLCLLLVSLLRCRGQPAEWVLVYAWNPLVLIENTHSGHNDVVALFFLMLALRLSLGRRETGAQLAFGFSVLAKIFTAPLWPFLLRGRWNRSLLLAALACPALILAVAIPYAAGGNLFEGLLAYGRHWHFNDSVFALLRSDFGFGSKEAARVPALVALAVGYALLLWRERDPVDGCAAVLGLMLLLMPTVHPWYVTWIVPFLALRPRVSWLLLTGTIILAYQVRLDFAASGNVVWEERPWIRLLVYLPFAAFWLWEQVRSPRAELAPQAPKA